MTTINKSCLITQLPVPAVISELIKSFAFYSIEETTKKNKVKKDKIVIVSINNGLFMGENDERWVKEIYIVGFNENNEIINNNSVIQMHSANCRMCGNYWSWDNILKIRCKCHENEEVYDEEVYDEEDYRCNRYYSDY